MDGTFSHGAIEFRYTMHHWKQGGVARFHDASGDEHQIPLMPGALDQVLASVPAEYRAAVEALYEHFWPRP